MSHAIATMVTEERRIADALHQSLSGVAWLPCNHAGDAWLTAYLPDRGLVCLEPVFDGRSVADAAAALVEAHSELQLTLERAGVSVPVEARIVSLEAPTDVPPRLARLVVDARDPVKLLAGLPEVRLEDEQALAVRETLWPEGAFEHRREHAADEGRDERVLARFQLDQDQLAVATGIGSGTTLVTGPAGSGKSLVLAARARMLAAAHPNWTIRLVCFNRALRPYLLNLVEGLPQVHVETIAELAERHHLRFAYAAEDQGFEAARRRLGDRGPDCDALLIDEAQDISAEWIQLAMSFVRDNRGGTLLAGDPSQSIYLDADDHQLGPLAAERIELTTAYRSTAPINAVADVLLDSERPAAGFPGPPVRVIYADNWDGQAEAVSHLVSEAHDREGYKWGDIAVLYTKRASQVRRLLEALDAAQVPNHWVGRDSDTKEEAAGDRVTISTVHSAKGLEFPVVFVFGVEALKGSMNTQRSLAHVAATRAQDRLTLTFTRPNDMLRRLSDHQSVEPRTWPDDWDGRG